jgi:hypothetical protein
MQSSERVMSIQRQIEIFPFFKEYLYSSFPIGTVSVVDVGSTTYIGGPIVDVVLTNDGVVLVKTTPRRESDNAQIAKAVLIYAGPIGMVARGLLEEYQSLTQDRKLETHILAPLVENGLAFSGLFKNLICEIQEEKRSLWDSINKECWVTFSGVFLYAGASLHGSFSFKFNESSKKAKKNLEDVFPIEVKYIEEKLTKADLILKWGKNVFGHRNYPVDVTKIPWCKNCIYFVEVVGWDDLKTGYFIAPVMPTVDKIPCKNITTTKHFWEKFYLIEHGKRTLYPGGCPNFTTKN